MENHKLRIAQVAPLYESVPPKFYGGTERVVSYLTEALVNQGHQVTLFASGDSVTSARLVAASQKSLRLDEHCIDGLAPHITMLQMVQNEIENFDIIHYHVDYLHFTVSKISSTPQLTTLHGKLTIPELQSLYAQYTDMPLVSISNAQRKPLSNVNWIKTVHHGIPQDLFSMQPGKGKYLAFLGRVSPEKGLDRAIEVAMRCDIPLKIAAKIDKVDQPYYEAHIKKYVGHPLVEFVGEIGESEKNTFLGEALALLFLIDWPEPFGLVMIESLACGTPIIAYSNGSVPEIISHGKTGFIVSSQQEAVEAVKNISSISRRACRAYFDERFTVQRMASEYIEAYHRVMQSKPSKQVGRWAPVSAEEPRKVKEPGVREGEEFEGRGEDGYDLKILRA
ncbi:MAG: glycosyltransferase family 4 protein [Bacteroidota bacterium]